MDRSCDVVIVGGGIAGAALGTALANDGLDVAVLEASQEYEDRVRGESLMPWGVKEARELGVEKALLDAGAHVAPAWVHYDPAIPVADAEANAIPVGMMVPDIPGSLNLRHPVACATLAALAVDAGVELHRGIADIALTAGPKPSVTCALTTGDTLRVDARLVVGADGRASTVRRQAGIELRRQPESNMIAGLLIDGLDGVDDGHDVIAGEGDLFMAAFHQGGGRMRVYLCPSANQRHRFSGPGGLDTFLASSGFSCLPFGEQLPHTTPAGPLATYPGDDSWTDEPFVDGVVLVGDSAGWNNPIIGQGLSISMRDARTVRDVLRGGDWSPAAFGDYATERLERMRRLRACADFVAAGFTDDAADIPARRARFFELQENEPLALGMMVAVFGGPEAGPPEAFDGRLLEMLRAA